MTPFLSIVVPIYNRAHTLKRCLDSIERQSFRDFEIVAVDDGSFDGSLHALRGFRNERLRVLSHDRNRGVCPARNTGIDASCGDWTVFLDSDDELASNDALARMAHHARHAPADLHALWFRSRLDDGRVAPDPARGPDVVDYRGYLRFLEATCGEPRDMIRCVRRGCFERVRYPENRMLEEKFHLDFAWHFRSRMHDDILRLYHQDAGNQLVMRLGRLGGRRDAGLVADRARGLRQLLAVHGRALSADAPRQYRELRRRALRSSLRQAFNLARGLA